MADNVAITAGSGTTVATDDVSGVHFQRVKLVNSTADSSTPTGVAADPLIIAGAIADDAAYAAGSRVLPVGFVVDDSSVDVCDEGDIGAARMSVDRKQIVVLGDAANIIYGGGVKTDTSAQSLMTASGDASIRNFLCWVTVYNSSATNTAVEIRDGAGTVRAVIPAPAYGGGISQWAHPLQGSGNTAWNAYSKASVSSIEVYGGGYRAK